MGLEDDTFNVIDVDSADDDDDFCDGGNGNGDSPVFSDLEGDGFDSDSAPDYAFISNDDLPHIRQQSQNNYTVLGEEDLRSRQEDDLTQVSSVLSISREAAIVLLRFYNWSVSTVHEEWFADEERVRQAAGLFEKPVVQISPADEEDVICGICFESYSLDEIRGAACGHPFCKTCWRGYITTAINDGSGCLILSCPQPSCNAAVGQDMVEDLVIHRPHKEKYRTYLVRSYVEDSCRKIKWCPGPECDFAIEFMVGSGNYDVTCRCYRGFCWNCEEDAHRPVDCDTVAKWIVKNNAEAENTNWILAFTKPCPKCKRPIEKNNGCMHMTCSKPCGFQFCWLCLESWDGHFTGTSPCNFFQAQQEGKIDKSERRREMARKSLQRYAHYYERWVANETSRQKALKDLHKLQTLQLVKLSEILCQNEWQLMFITDAWLQIVECRRMLKWTYAYGYYLPDNEDTKRRFFEYLQGQAEAALERLHLCAEKELDTYLKSGEHSENFKDFRAKLIGLTVVTGNYFENLVRALEKGLVEVDSEGACSRTSTKRSSGWFCGSTVHLE